MFILKKRKVSEEYKKKDESLEANQFNNQFSCFVDASWISSDEKADFGQILKTAQGREIMRGYASAEPVLSSTEAEAIALREVMVQMNRWGYYDVCFFGDAKEVYGKLLDETYRGKIQVWAHHELSTYIKDIRSMMLSIKDYRVCFINRGA